VSGKAGVATAPGNKRTLERQAERMSATAGDSPPAYMLGVMRDGQADPAMRLEAARTAAPARRLGTSPKDSIGKPK